MSRRLVLFDIDGTLLSAGRISARVFGEALLEAFGTTGEATGFDYSGKTDPQIVRELMRGADYSVERKYREGEHQGDNSPPAGGRKDPEDPHCP